MLLECVIPGPPVGKGRPVFSTRGGRVTARTPTKTRDWERAAAGYMLAARPPALRLPVTCPCELRVRAVAPRLKKMGPSAVREWRCAKPDGDNVLKAVADALVLAGIIEDDVQLVVMTVVSEWAATGEGAGVWVEMGVAR